MNVFHRAALLVAALVFSSCLVSTADAQVKPRILVALDTSGSMALDLDGTPTFGDGVAHPTFGTGCRSAAGVDTNCDGLLNDSRMFIAKDVLTNTFLSYGDVDWALARFAQSQSVDAFCNSSVNVGAGTVSENATIDVVECPGSVSSYGDPTCNADGAITGGSCPGVDLTDWPIACRPGSGGNPPFQHYDAVDTWLDIGVPGLGIAPLSGDGNNNTNPLVCINYLPGACGSTAASGDVIVGFPDMGAFSGVDNTFGLLSWLDNVETSFNTTTTTGNFCNSAGGGNCEVRPIGRTPLAGILLSASAYMTPIRSGDGASACRPYSVILVTDGVESCGGNPSAAAATLLTAGIQTFVIGVSINPAEIPTLNAIAAAGGTSAAFLAADPDTLSAAISSIVADSLLVETCNNLDDDCDGATDEGFTKFCNAPGSMALTQCVDPGEICDGIDNNCNGATDEGVTNACGVCGATPPEICDGADNNCNGIIDEGGVCGGCVPSAEICDGIDNDCDGSTDESLVRGCGTDVGECSSGSQSCAAGAWGACSGTGPATETCNNLDDDCDGIIDGITRPCGTGVGECVPGTETCSTGTFGACIGAVGPTAEVCDTRDNDCDGTADELNPGGGGSCGSSIGECAPGTLQCSGGALVCSGGVGPTGETCDGDDDDCDGSTDEGVPSAGACGSSVGECSPGVLLCSGGSFTCTGDVGPAAEICDGRDNDCDGTDDEGNPGAGASCGSGVGDCVPGMTTCSAGTLICAGGVSPSTEVCDAGDNDCDGATDEAIAPAGTCGSSTGECQTGLRLCTGGAFVCTGDVGATAEVCDGRDNDCDGSADEGNPEGGGACGSGVGACVPGSLNCVGGSLSCGGGVGPSAETCNSADDDCDGATDEGNPGGGATCGSDIGECSTGTDVCTAGTLTCSGDVGPSAESCDSLDNDCDSRIDEGDPGGGGTCGTDIGACTAGTLTCTAGSITCAGEVGPTIDLCDGIDNDCDGATDEGNPGGGDPCGSSIGACSPGTLTCAGGALICGGGATPVAETCNAADDDCDGTTDEAVPSAGACGSALGECREGALTCVGGSFVCAGDRGPVAEICDALDNDCDASTDEGNPGGGVACGTMTGSCELGTSACVAGGLTCLGGVDPLPETCNSADDDCDGLVDEGGPGGGGPCGSSDVGECEFGAEACVMGALTCVGETGPGAEICDGLDNDCDGSIDEGDPEGGAACGDATGECSPGVTRCTAGELVCDGGVGPTVEICDGLDNDCDGVEDEGLGVGAPCGSDTGECTPGVNICRGGRLECEGAIDPLGETCDNLDNDCDGVIDEALPLGGPCGSDIGVCMEGSLQCVDGVDVCVGEVPPAGEGCDCEDNDCDGEVDETAAGSSLCPDGSECVECACSLPCMESEFGFTCPTGKAPRVGDTGECFCVAERCNPTTCGAETVERDGDVLCAPDADGVTSCVCKNNECTFSCDGVVCADGTVCDPRDPAGRCAEDSCRGLGCPAGEVCSVITGACEADPCVDVTCGATEACRDGACEGSCADVTCGATERCAAGVCVTDACADVSCAVREVCDPADGSCTEDLCTGVRCPTGSLCDPVTAECSADPCDTLTCPGEQACEDGECAEVVVVTPDAGPPDAGPVDSGPAEAPGRRVYATGNGGCVCAVAPGAKAGGENEAPALLLTLGLFGLVLLRRRRGLLGLLVAGGATLVLTGCDVTPFCLDCFEGEGDSGMADSAPVDTGTLDTGVEDSGVIDSAVEDASFDGCMPGAPELCNELDDDCDGVVDEGIDTDTEVAHCGGCGMACAPAHAFGACGAGVCGIASCDVGWFDLNGDLTDGCEYRCLPTEPDDALCDLRDGDCDGEVDEDVDFDADPVNCGACGRVCRFAHVVSPQCTAGACVFDSATDCEPDFHDIDGVPDNGCEYACMAADPAVETCNGRDDDCDGSIDEGDPEGGAVCGTDDGECSVGVEMCSGGAIICSGETAPTTEACNGLDDDCDSSIDESNPDGGRLCGDSVGACAQGREECMAGALVCIGATDPVGELCNGLDDDCDGSIDEGDPDGGGSCGDTTGSCSAGTFHCRGGIVICEGAVGPVDETCNGADDDCDGSADEGNPGGGGSCGTDVGACLPGVRTCTAGAIACVGATAGGAETCNSLDDDCDGSVDEGDPGGGASCGTDTGACVAGLERCVGGAVACIGSVAGGAELCNGVDDDCDGSTDEGDPGGGASCGSDLGACMAGSFSCTGGTLVCTGGVSSAAETCDGVDEDCDGRVDEGVASMGACGSTAGECEAGIRSCVGGAFTCVGGTGPTAEICDGRDNDCDGSVDDGNPDAGGFCGSGVGACVRGTEVCAGGSLVCAGATGPGLETCNNTDDDCDGAVDEGNPDGGALCGSDVGTCVSGVQQCVAGSLSCVGATGPGTETCNSLDDNCDGVIDEGNPGGGGACGVSTGACTPGSLVCTAGALSCVGGTGPTVETCNGIDDNCDGSVDEGNPGGGGLCGSDVGACSTGTRVCSGGSLSCVGDTGAGAETCNSLDDDCDGNVDEGNPGGGGSCGTSVGRCSAGTNSCVGGAVTCVGAVGATPETCNTFDDDCDGSTDETFDLTNDPNNCGSCGMVCNLPFATSTCTASTCRIVGCEVGHVDFDTVDSTGCEYACDFAGAEVCNGQDDDCDMATDELPPPPNFCNANGVCMGTAATCGGASGWQCVYPGTFEDSETLCDDLDNDCDGAVDEPFALKGTSCSNGVGECQRFGTQVCAASQDAVECNAATAGTPVGETCNGLDDDCDGTVDDGVGPTIPVVTVPRSGGGTVDVMVYEASRPDSTSGDAGSNGALACSAANVLPWTNVTWGEADGACRAIGTGWRLCDGADWEVACEAGSGCEWSYSSSCSSSSSTRCNGEEFDCSGAGGDQDCLFTTGSPSFPGCYARWSAANRIYDLSGNVKEWTNTSRGVGVHEIRGGSYNNVEAGRTCTFDNTLGDGTFSFPNTGFRCCHY